MKGDIDFLIKVYSCKSEQIVDTILMNEYRYTIEEAPLSYIIYPDPPPDRIPSHRGFPESLSMGYIYLR
jgi:hypothetical protein